MSEAAWDAYCGAVVKVQTDHGPLRIAPAQQGICRGPFLGAPADTVHIITAHISHGVTAAANRERQSELQRTLARRSVRYWAAQGGDVDWTHVEESAAVIGLSEQEALDLGHQFDQDAIFAWTAQAWTLLSCRDDRSELMGWRSSMLAS